jgi:hypothetical protein
MEDASLEGAEQATTARNCQYHAAELTEELLPGLKRDTFATAKISKDGTEAGIAVWGQFQGLFDSVNEPAKEHFGSAPATVTLE